MNLEKWKQIPGWDYSASSLGRIRNDRTATIRKPVLRDGYLQIALTDHSRKLWSCVNRFVALAFHGEPPSTGMEARHLNGVRTDNRPENIEWGTPQQNIDDRARHGMTASGSRNGGAKLSNRQVRRIRQDYDEHMSNRVAEGRTRARRGFMIDLAMHYGLHVSQITKIALRRSWK